MHTWLLQARHSWAKAPPTWPQVTYSDVVPGLRRFDHHGQLSTARHLAISTLAAPMLAQPHAVALQGATISLPQRLHDLLAAYIPGGGVLEGLLIQPRLPRSTCWALSAVGHPALDS
jgi:hypothetical protein